MAEPIQIALALGSNIGDRLNFLRGALAGIAPYAAIAAVSSIYETPAAYVTDQPAFLNAALLATTTIEPLALLYTLKDLERDIGRQPTFRYGPRAIDIDILFYGTVCMETAELTLPHPRMAERDFVLRPLCDIAPGWVHPRLYQSAAQMLAALPVFEVQNLGRIL